MRNYEMACQGTRKKKREEEKGKEKEEKGKKGPWAEHDAPCPTIQMQMSYSGEAIVKIATGEA